MKKHLPLVIALLISVATWVFPQQPSDRERLGFRGNVKSVLREAVLYSEQAGKWVASPRQLAEEWLFSPEGRRVRWVTFHQDGNWDEHNGEGDHRSVSVTYNSDGSIKGQTVYTSGPDGQAASQTAYDSEGYVTNQSTWTYDPSGKLLEQSNKEGDGSLIDKLVPSYSPDGSSTGYVTYDGNGNVTSSVTNTSGLDQDEIIHVLANGSPAVANGVKRLSTAS